MDLLFELLHIILPSLLIAWVVSLMLKRQNETQALWIEKQVKQEKTPSINIRLKAYERLTLFAERISPEKLIQRQLTQQMTCSQLQMKLLQNIRQEYEHNLAQQLYVSDEAWKAISMAKESIIQLINASMTQVKAEESALNLSSLIIETYHNAETTPTEVALSQLKKETVTLLS